MFPPTGRHQGVTVDCEAVRGTGFSGGFRYSRKKQFRTENLIVKYHLRILPKTAAISNNNPIPKVMANMRRQSQK